jgi:hypothetical protein
MAQVCPPISTVRSPVILRLILERSILPFAASNKIRPFDDAVLIFAESILKGNPPALLVTGLV